MYQYTFPDDPNYCSTQARFVRDYVQTLIEYEVVPDPSLTDELVEIDARARQIRVRPGQQFRAFHTLVNRAMLYVVGGSSWAEEFHTKPSLRVIRGSGG